MAAPASLTREEAEAAQRERDKSRAELQKWMDETTAIFSAARAGSATATSAAAGSTESVYPTLSQRTSSAEENRGSAAGAAAATVSGEDGKHSDESAAQPTQSDLDASPSTRPPAAPSVATRFAAKVSKATKTLKNFAKRFRTGGNPDPAVKASGFVDSDAATLQPDALGASASASPAVEATINAEERKSHQRRNRIDPHADGPDGTGEDQIDTITGRIFGGEFGYHRMYFYTRLKSGHDLLGYPISWWIAASERTLLQLSIMQIHRNIQSRTASLDEVIAHIVYTAATRLGGVSTENYSELFAVAVHDLVMRTIDGITRKLWKQQDPALYERRDDSVLVRLKREPELRALVNAGFPLFWLQDASTATIKAIWNRDSSYVPKTPYDKWIHEKFTRFSVADSNIAEVAGKVARWAFAAMRFDWHDVDRSDWAGADIIADRLRVAWNTPSEITWGEDDDRLQTYRATVNRFLLNNIDAIKNSVLRSVGRDATLLSGSFDQWDMDRVSLLADTATWRERLFRIRPLSTDTATPQPASSDSELERRLKATEAQLRTAQSALKIVTGRAGEHKSELDRAVSALQQAQGALRDCEKRVAELQERIRHLESTIAFKDTVILASSEQSDDGSQLQRLRGQLQAAQAEKEQFLRSADDSARETRAEISRLREQLAEGERERQRLQRERDQATAEHRTREERHRDINTQLGEAAASIKSLTDQRNALQRQIVQEQEQARKKQEAAAATLSVAQEEKRAADQERQATATERQKLTELQAKLAKQQGDLQQGTALREAERASIDQQRADLRKEQEVIERERTGLRELKASVLSEAETMRSWTAKAVKRDRQVDERASVLDRKERTLAQQLADAQLQHKAAQEQLAAEKADSERQKRESGEGDVPMARPAAPAPAPAPARALKKDEEPLGAPKVAVAAPVAPASVPALKREARPSLAQLIRGVLSDIGASGSQQLESALTSEPNFHQALRTYQAIFSNVGPSASIEAARRDMNARSDNGRAAMAFLLMSNYKGTDLAQQLRLLLPPKVKPEVDEHMLGEEQGSTASQLAEQALENDGNFRLFLKEWFPDLTYQELDQFQLLLDEDDDSAYEAYKESHLNRADGAEFVRAARDMNDVHLSLNRQLAAVTFLIAFGYRGTDLRTKLDRLLANEVRTRMKGAIAPATLPRLELKKLDVAIRDLLPNISVQLSSDMAESIQGSADVDALLYYANEFQDSADSTEVINEARMDMRGRRGVTQTGRYAAVAFLLQCGYNGPDLVRKLKSLVPDKPGFSATASPLPSRDGSAARAAPAAPAQAAKPAGQGPGSWSDAAKRVNPLGHPDNPAVPVQPVRAAGAGGGGSGGGAGVAAGAGSGAAPPVRAAATARRQDDFGHWKAALDGFEDAFRQSKGNGIIYKRDEMIKLIKGILDLPQYKAFFDEDSTSALRRATEEAVQFAEKNYPGTTGQQDPPVLLASVLYTVLNGGVDPRVVKGLALLSGRVGNIRGPLKASGRRRRRSIGSSTSSSSNHKSAQPRSRSAHTAHFDTSRNTTHRFTVNEANF